MKQGRVQDTRGLGEQLSFQLFDLPLEPAHDALVVGLPYPTVAFQLSLSALRPPEFNRLAMLVEEGVKVRFLSARAMAIANKLRRMQDRVGRTLQSA